MKPLVLLVAVAAVAAPYAATESTAPIRFEEIWPTARPRLSAEMALRLEKAFG